jgi:two-component system chemotaxis response regulator CheV
MTENGLESQITGVVKQEGGMILLLDFEKIVVDINPASGITKDRLSTLGERDRSTKKLMIVEDSPLLRKLIKDTLSEAGYTNLQSKPEIAELVQIIDQLIL